MITVPVLCIAVSMVFVIDLSGFVINMKRKWWKRKYSIKPFEYFDYKPFDCSLCMTVWLSTLYMLITWSICVENITIICLFSFSTPLIKDAMILSYDLVSYALNWIRKRYINTEYDDMDI